VPLDRLLLSHRKLYSRFAKVNSCTSLSTHPLSLLIRRIISRICAGIYYSGVTLNVARPDMNNDATLGVMLY